MLVYISKGLVNVQSNLTQAVIQKGKIDDRATGFPKLTLSLYTRVDIVNEGTPVETVFTYDLSDEENYNADFKLLKDCFLNACRQSNISVFFNSDVVGYQGQRPRDTNTTTAGEASNAQQVRRSAQVGLSGIDTIVYGTSAAANSINVTLPTDYGIFNNINLPEDGDGEDYT